MRGKHQGRLHVLAAARRKDRDGKGEKRKILPFNLVQNSRQVQPWRSVSSLVVESRESVREQMRKPRVLQKA